MKKNEIKMVFKMSLMFSAKKILAENISVDSKPTNDFLMSLLPSPSTLCWIGGHDGVQVS